MSPNLRWTLLVAAEALLILIMLKFGLLFTGTLWIHQLQVIVLGVTGAIGWIAVLRRPSMLPLPLVLAPLPLLGTMALAALFSRYPSLSWGAIWQTAAFAGIFWLLAIQASHPAGRRNLIAVVGIVVVVVLASYFLAVGLAWKGWLDLGLPVTSLPARGAANGGLATLATWLSDLVALTVPLLVVSMWRANARILAAVLGVISLGAIVLTGTRSVLVLVVAVAILLVALANRTRVGRRASVVAVVIVGVAAAAVILGAGRSFDEGRSSAFTSAFDRIQSSPVLGTGPGTFGVLRMSDPVDVLEKLTFPDAHNIVLTTVAETGVVGLGGLTLTVALLGLAIRRSWRERPGNRPIIAGALAGVAVFAGHGMVDVVFGLVGIIALAIALIALATTHEGPRLRIEGPRSRRLDAGLLLALVVVLAASGMVVRSEIAHGNLADAEALLPHSPSEALATARGVTDATPDSVPAWWVQMVAADGAGDTASAIAAARKTVELEGFGQEWLTLAILASRSDDRATALDALGHATAGPPVDRLVELNAVILLDDAGDANGAEEAARRLLEVQPDIGAALGDGPSSLATTVARVRPDVAGAFISNGDPNSAFLVALSAEDRQLAEALLAKTDPSTSDTGFWRSVVGAWFGNEATRTALDASAQSDPTVEHLDWAWRLAAHACDAVAAEHWSDALALATGDAPAMPYAMGVTPDFQARLLPLLYPGFVWRLGNPERPYVIGTWTFVLGPPTCVAK